MAEEDIKLTKELDRAKLAIAYLLARKKGKSSEDYEED